ncbi:hypothetical protein ABIA30_003761 [Mycobacterium sp. MAA66]
MVVKAFDRTAISSISAAELPSDEISEKIDNGK